jgi:hypothetical protein
MPVSSEAEPQGDEGRCGSRAWRCRAARLPAKLTLASAMVLPSWACLAGRAALALGPGGRWMPWHAERPPGASDRANEPSRVWIRLPSGLGAGAGLVGGARAARAGHASVSFTLDRYGHLYPRPTPRSATVWTRSNVTAQPVPVTSSVSANSGEALCQPPFVQSGSLAEAVDLTIPPLPWGAFNAPGAADDQRRIACRRLWQDP